MSVKFKVSSSAISNLQIDEKLHFIPAKINADVESNVKDKFEIYCNIDNSESDVISNSLRGFPLKGTQMSVPPGYSGVILKETNSGTSEDSNRELVVDGMYTTFTYWNWDRDPSSNDAFQQAASWLDLSRALHNPV